LAEVANDRSYSEINRIEQLRSITITADVDDSLGNAHDVVKQLQKEFMPDLLERYPSIHVRWEGQKEQSDESINSLFVGFLVAVFGMYCLLTLEFRSYFQPLLILTIIPFGFMGAIWGHATLGLPLTIFSMFGLVSLTGVVVNDSIVLVAFIKLRLAEGKDVIEAVHQAGMQRFRPVFLTSATTVAGLLPIMLETSLQAQFLIPMAVSISFGLMFATVVVLVLIPSLYSILAWLGWSQKIEAAL